MSNEDYKFEGWIAFDKDSINGKMVWKEYEPKPWEETDIDIKISHCGICGTDLHTLRSGWKETLYPCCVGHEIVGVAVRVGSKAEGDVKIGDRVGVGAQSESCLERKGECGDCASGKENYCSVHYVGTYDAVHLNGGKSYGGYARYHRCPSHFVFKIPDGIPSAEAAVMLCAGSTTYAPLKLNGCGPGKRVGIIGIGGLGHFAVLFAKALGADKVVAISRTRKKSEDALKMGADAYIAMDEGTDWADANAYSFDIVVSTSSSSKVDLSAYFRLLHTHGTFVQLGYPEDGPISIPAGVLVRKGLIYQGSWIASPAVIKELLQVAAEKKLRPWVKEIPMKDANTAVVEASQGKTRYRYVLVN